MDDQKKRKGSPTTTGSDPKKQKKQWRTPKKGQPQFTPLAIEPGDAGIWATCVMGKEGKSVADLRDLFEEYALKIHGPAADDECIPGDQGSGRKQDDDGTEKEAEDIEASISAEVNDLKSSSAKRGSLFRSVKVDVPCVLFFKTSLPIDPVTFVHRICTDAAGGLEQRKCRFVKRLTPMTRMGKATVSGLEEVCGRILGRGLGGEGVRKFAIRSTIRNNDQMKRDDVIRQIAGAVGPGYSVDLRNPDVVILIEIYRNVLGLSVVDGEYEELKRYNLAEIWEPSPKPTDDAIEGVAEGEQGNRH